MGSAVGKLCLAPADEQTFLQKEHPCMYLQSDLWHVPLLKAKQKREGRGRMLPEAYSRKGWDETDVFAAFALTLE